MNNTKHTPGPWTVEMGFIPEVRGKQVAVCGPINIYGSMRTVCLITECSTENDADRANAKLIAAAPELLEVLQDWVNDHKSKYKHPPLDKFHIRAITAIKKATDE